jgi:hypothetical protein
MIYRRTLAGTKIRWVDSVHFTDRISSISQSRGSTEGEQSSTYSFSKPCPEFFPNSAIKR